MKPDLRLFEGESVRAVLTPHPLAFYGMHAVFVYVIFLSAVFFFFGGPVLDYFSVSEPGVSLRFAGKSSSPLIAKTPFFGPFASVLDSVFGGVVDVSLKYGMVTLWLILLFTPSVLVSVFRITWRWMAYVLLIAVAGVVPTILFSLDYRMAYVLASFFSVAAMVLVDLYRRGHKYIITNFRLITDVRFIYNIRDDINYDKINNLVMNQSLLGRAFDFGTIMPLTASGLGVGEDFASLTLGAGKQLSSGVLVGGALTGGRSVNFPRSMVQFSLVGVRHPRQVADLVSEFVHLDDEVTYLRGMSSDLKSLVSEVKKNKKGGKSGL